MSQIILKYLQHWPGSPGIHRLADTSRQCNQTKGVLSVEGNRKQV